MAIAGCASGIGSGRRACSGQRSAAFSASPIEVWPACVNSWLLGLDRITCSRQFLSSSLGLGCSRLVALCLSTPFCHTSISRHLNFTRLLALCLSTLLCHTSIITTLLFHEPRRPVPLNTVLSHKHIVTLVFHHLDGLAVPGCRCMAAPLPLSSHPAHTHTHHICATCRNWRRRTLAAWQWRRGCRHTTRRPPAAADDAQPYAAAVWRLATRRPCHT